MGGGEKEKEERKEGTDGGREERRKRGEERREGREEKSGIQKAERPKSDNLGVIDK